ncbi:multicopper oxidase domain-containing protein [Myxococcus sp. AM011]|uniref:multicopper oxidase domain-containing protein n=2 Tax=Myxococcus TaxID=32 RepID=UPI0013D7EA17|nr:multicopper oxidase domain-containing protein [Myxococcus sp. AM011]NVJ26357.1 multicopper oxidase domain-containing protein [Myxococcus sp. AM011]
MAPAQEKAVGSSPQAVAEPPCGRTLFAEVVAMDQVYTYNRLGSFNPTGMIYALMDDVEPISVSKPAGPGNVRLKTNKRPRPLTLRANVGDCLQVKFHNWLAPTRSAIPSPNESQPGPSRAGGSSTLSFLRKVLPLWVWTITYDPVQSLIKREAVGGRWFWLGEDKEAENDHRDNSPATRHASIHIQGLQYRNIFSDGANVGNNPSSLVPSGGSFDYVWYADHEGVFFFHSMGASFGGEGDGGSTAQGLFGAVNVEPPGSTWYRSKVSEGVLKAVTTGTNPDGTPLIQYNAVDGSGRPHLAILDSNRKIRHGDLEAIITGYTSTSVGTLTSVDQGHFRELTAIYHDEIKAVQAFDELEWNPTFHSVRDGFGVNYGVAGLGAELIANRAKIGPTKDCVTCEYEEFFLESWANGDPAMNVEKDSSGKAVAALYPDDPTNVHHSYLGDPVRIRNIHAGPAETHVFHLHAHQWKYSPAAQDSNYLDSQTVSPGSAFTYDINFGGSGNRNLTVGDSIHHCHLYPHFAQGMWALWRVHDVFEAGTKDRVLPDAEIKNGTPNPAVIPIPSRAMPPMPTYVATTVSTPSGLRTRPAFPGYPFYIPGMPGRRTPQAPLDLEFDGGLPRHIVTNAVGPVAYGNSGRFDVDPTALNIKLLPQAGTPTEQAAMAFHSGDFPSSAGVTAPTIVPLHNDPTFAETLKYYPAYTPLGGIGKFLVNGRQPVAGAPFADPCPARTTKRNYRATYLQIAMQRVNRAGWHDPQARLMVLNEDVAATQDGKRPPEPFFFRAESGECINFYATNLIPAHLEPDDFQIYTPTDVIGQHIHLVKFDVTAADGAGNGWNYEDGTLSADTVAHRIHLANAAGGAFAADGNVTETGTRVYLTAPASHPRIPRAPGTAQTSVQRWWADPLISPSGKEHPLETVFTHDHFGPSSHQQHGFYGALIVEPKGSKWRDPRTGIYYGSRVADGGPTSWSADIITPNPANSFREFAIAFADYVPLYDECGKPVNPPNYKETSLPWAVDFWATPMPEAISAADPGGMTINYHNEPIPHRISSRISCSDRVQRSGARGDMANVFRSDIHGDPYTPVMYGNPGDNVRIRLIQGSQEEQHSFTLHGNKWLKELYEPDSGYYNAQAIGISEKFEFNLTGGLPQIVGPYETADYMYMSASTGDLWNGMWGILRTTKNRLRGTRTLADVAMLAADENPKLQTVARGAANGEAQAYPPLNILDLPPEAGLQVLDPDKERDSVQDSYEVDETGKPVKLRTVEHVMADREGMIRIDKDMVLKYEELQWFGTKPVKTDSCPKGAPVRIYRVSAIDAKNHIFGKRVVYNDRYKIYDPDAIIFAQDTHLAALKSGARKPEPLILRARAGECVQVILTNRLPSSTLPKTNIWAHHSAITPRFNVNQVRMSNHVSLHPQLVNYDVNVDDGANVGLNAVQTVPPGGARTYRWFAGEFKSSPLGTPFPLSRRTSMEFGIVNLRNMADVVNHGMHGAIGALIIEPTDASWSTDPGTEAQAYVSYTKADGKPETFREFVALFQDDLGLHSDDSTFWDTDGLSSYTALRNTSGIDDSQDTGQKGFNYRTEPLWARLGLPPQTSPDIINDRDLRDILSSSVHGDPATPVFLAKVGDPLRWRFGHPSGHSRQHAISMHGAEWRRNPWAAGTQSRVMGPNATSPIISTQGGASVMQSYTMIPEYGAGGASSIKGDYMYRDHASFLWSGGGLWGVYRVQ